MRSVPRLGALLSAVLLLSGCGGAPSGVTAPPTSPVPAAPPVSGGPVAVLALADGAVLAVSTVDGSVIARAQLAPPARSTPGQVLAAGQAGGPLYVLTRDGVAALDPGTLADRGRHRLRDGVRYSSLVVGESSGRLYAFGEGRLTVLEPGRGIVEPDRGRAVDGLTATRPADWFVQAAAVSPDERYAVLSYHGETGGGDLVPLVGSPLAGCDPGSDARRSGCLAEVHGLVVATESGILAATGGEAILAVSYDGAVRRRWDHGLPGNHLMEFAVAGTVLFAVGPCGYSGGLSRIDTASGSVRVLVPARAGPPDDGAATGGPAGGAATAGPTAGGPDPRAGAVCGERVAAVADGPVAVVDGRLLRLVDPSTGAVRQTVELPADALDVLIRGPSG